jgi:hypothetical protein
MQDWLQQAIPGQLWVVLLYHPFLGFFDRRRQKPAGDGAAGLEMSS